MGCSANGNEITGKSPANVWEIKILLLHSNTLVRLTEKYNELYEHKRPPYKTHFLLICSSFTFRVIPQVEYRQLPDWFWILSYYFKVNFKLMLQAGHLVVTESFS